MNIFQIYTDLIVKLIKENQVKLKIIETNKFRGVTVENPPPEFNFDLSCNICLVLAKINKLNPKKLADEFKAILFKECKNIYSIDVAGPGFLNIKLSNSELKVLIKKIYNEKKSYGASKNKKKYNIEFVSANPTGPLHVGHCRGAVYGDVLSNLLKFNGNEVTKEYYINDYGNQIQNFTKSVFLRIREIKYNEKFVNEKDLYPGEYIKDIAKQILSDKLNHDFNDFKKDYILLSKESLKYSMELIKSDLKKLGITHDNFFSETKLVKENLVDKTVKLLTKKKFVVEGYLDPPKGEPIKEWKKIKRLIFKSTLFGDDSDRALQKNDGSWTYFANDVAYHFDKVSRNYDYLINVLGADHTGYIKRIESAVSAISEKKVKLNCKVCQLVKLYKDGKPYKMSKRSGEFISASDLLSEVNKDSIRFMMLNRSNDVELEFDFNKVLEKNKDNPVFYVQYCYARIKSLFRSANIKNEDQLLFDDKFALNEYENKILRKIFDWPKTVETASKKYEPHRISYYLYDLATLFHSYWSKGNEDDKYKFLSNVSIKNKNTFAIIRLIPIVIENGMNILGVSLPEKM